MEAVVASMQVQYLTSSMHAHLHRLCALREQQQKRFASPSSRYVRLYFGILIVQNRYYLVVLLCFDSCSTVATTVLVSLLLQTLTFSTSKMMLLIFRRFAMMKV